VTQTLDWREALGETPAAPRPSEERTTDFDHVMRSLVAGEREGGAVRNLPIRSSGTETPRWTARAALDTDHRRLISMMFEPIAGGRLDEEIDATIRERVSRLALQRFPPGSTIEWSDEVDEIGDVYSLMSVRTPATPSATHDAYRAFVGAWVRAEPPENRSRIRVSCRPVADGRRDAAHRAVRACDARARGRAPR